MKRIRIRMIASVDQLSGGEEYNLPQDFADQLISNGKAQRLAPRFEAPTFAPSETKPIEAQEIKRKGKRA